jgi:hypothetical protein
MPLPRDRGSNDGARGRTRTTRSAAARAALEKVLPTSDRGLRHVRPIRDALDRFDNLVARLPSALNLFRLLEARPACWDCWPRPVARAALGRSGAPTRHCSMG